MAVLWLPLFQENQNCFKEINLKGEFLKPEKPKFSVDSFLSQSFQKKWSDYKNYNLGFKGLFVKIRNSLNYIFFRELSVVDNVAGKDGFIFSRGSAEQTAGKEYLGKEKNKATIEKINFMKNELEKKGVRFLVVIAPSKELIYPDYLPPPYRGMHRSQTNYSDFVQGYKTNNIPFIDFCPFFKNFRDTSKFPVFTKTGYHWSMYAASLAQDSILNYIEHSLSKPIPKYKSVGIELSDTARISDADFEDPLNLFFSLQESRFFYRKLEMVKSSEKNYHPKVIIIGDSFFWIIKHQKVLPDIFSSESRYWYYFKKSFPLSDDAWNEIKDVDVVKELESSDYVILFSNVGTLYGFPYGVTDYYYAHITKPEFFQNDKKTIKKFFHLKAANNKYVCADAAHNDIVIADRDTASSWETFSLLELGNNQCAIYSSSNKFFSAELGQHGEITATRDNIAGWETFTIVKLENNFVAFKAANGKNLSLDEKTLQLYAKGDSIGRNEKFEMIVK